MNSADSLQISAIGRSGYLASARLRPFRRRLCGSSRTFSSDGAVHGDEPVQRQRLFEHLDGIIAGSKIATMEGGESCRPAFSVDYGTVGGESQSAPARCGWPLRGQALG